MIAAWIWQDFTGLMLLMLLTGAALVGFVWLVVELVAWSKR